MPSTLTYTGKIGPGNTLTAKVFSDVTDIAFHLDRKTIEVTHAIPPRISHLDYVGVATITYTISGTNATITVS